jgi:drug/metabolite transporter (DMT)-like permease
MLYDWQTPSTHDLLILLLVGICTQMAQLFMTKAYMLERAANISHYNYLTSIYAIAAGFIFFGETPNGISMLGIALIMFSVFFSNRIKA